MLTRHSIAGALSILLLAGCNTFSTSVHTPPLKYPAAVRTNVVDTYFGTSVPDPYRWLEDDNSAETKAWVEAQNAVTFGYLSGIPARGVIKDRMTRLMNYERTGLPYKRGGRYFYSRNNGLQNQDVWFTAPSLEAEPTVLLDPNALSGDGTVSVSAPTPSEDGRLAAYQISASGSDWKEIRIRDVATGKDLPERVQWVKFSGIAWKKDGSGFFYSRYDAPKESEKLTRLNEFQKLYFHKIGTDQSQDELAYERKDHPRWGFGGSVTDDGRYLIITINEGTDPKNRVFYKDLTVAGAVVVELLTDFDASYDFVGNDGPVFWFRTDLKAPRGRLIAIDTRRPARGDWKEVVGQTEATLTQAGVVGERLVLEYLKDARSQVKLHRLDGSLEREVTLPGIGSAAGFGGKREESETFYSFTGYTTPGRVYRHDLATGETKLWREPKVDFNPDAFETKQVWVTSKDGTKLPMFVTHKKGLKLDGNNPVLLYGYGGFNISLTPAFSVGNLVWMEMGGVYAVPNLRGGGEYGEEWHQAGTKLRKQNVFDDFIASAEWLVRNGYTNPKRLAIQGGSNGGLLVGACMTQRPELYGACLPAVGVMDMLRFHKFTIGWAWKSDYGSSEDAAEFKALHAYSPYHNLKPGVSYPPTMVTTADHDDRVVPAHSFKFAARLQESHRGPNPVLIRIETKAGHGAGKPTAKVIEERSDQLAFLVHHFGMKVGKN